MRKTALFLRYEDYEGSFNNFQVSWSLSDRLPSPAPVTLKPVPMETSERSEQADMESTTSRRKETSSSTTEETTRRKVLQELMEMTTNKKESSTTRRRNMGTVRRGSRQPMSQRSSVRRRLDKSVTQSSAPSSWTPRPRMVRPSYRGAGGRDRAPGLWERKGSALSKKPLRRMKIRGGGPSNR